MYQVVSGEDLVGTFLREEIARLKGLERTLVVRPEDAEMARSLAADVPLLRVQESILIPKGKMFLLNLNALDEGWRPE